MENEKGLSPQVKKYLSDLGKTKDEIDALAANMAGKAQAAQEAGIESKEAAPEAEAQAQPDTPTFVTAQEVADAVIAITQPMMDTINNVTVQLAAMQAEVKALKESDATKIAAKSAATPQASLGEIISRGLLGMEAARIDGRTELAKAGPRQAPVEETDNITPVSLVNKLMRQAQGTVQQ